MRTPDKEPEGNDLGHPPGDGPFLLFTYGTLKSDQCRGGVLAGQEKIGQARTTKSLVLLTGGAYPCLVRPQEGDEPQHVRGELYNCDRQLLKWLDRIEGSPFLFKLERIELEGVEEAVYAYIFQDRKRGRDGLRLVHGEEWTA